MADHVIAMPEPQGLPGDWPDAPSVDDAQGMLAEAFAVRYDDGITIPVLLTLVSRLPEMTGGAVTVAMADQMNAELDDGA